MAFKVGKTTKQTSEQTQAQTQQDWDRYIAPAQDQGKKKEG